MVPNEIFRAGALLEAAKILEFKTLAATPENLKQLDLSPER
jgi:hypothetical protein